MSGWTDPAVRRNLGGNKAGETDQAGDIPEAYICTVDRFWSAGYCIKDGPHNVYYNPGTVLTLVFRIIIIKMNFARRVTVRSGMSSFLRWKEIHAFFICFSKITDRMTGMRKGG